MLLLSGCGAEAKGSPQRQTAASPPPVSTPVLSGRRRYRGTPTLGSAVASDFTLPDQTGRPVRLSDERGRIVLITFLYTRCPDVCPLIAENINKALLELGPRRRSVRVLAISVDPVHDTRVAVQDYVTEHHLVAQFHYLIGTASELKPVWQSYNVLIETRSLERVSHSTYVLLIDGAGRPRLYYPAAVTAADLLHDLRLYVKTLPGGRRAPRS